ncbi:MAG TPA: hypothetical protein VK956_08945, partial [Verrucomicrobium sp.]|nr:hypothetical protein [Verrucomicrobium sp.]
MALLTRLSALALGSFFLQGAAPAADAIPEELLSLGRAEPLSPIQGTDVPSKDSESHFTLQRLHVTHKFDCPVALAVMPGETPREVLMQQRGEVWVLPSNDVVGEPEKFLDFREH